MSPAHAPVIMAARVLIIGQNADPHVVEVQKYINSKCDIFDAHNFDNFKFNPKTGIILNGVPLKNYSAIWWRFKWPSFKGSKAFGAIEEHAHEFWRAEWSQITWAIAVSANAPIINNPLTSILSSNKIFQLEIAEKIGMKVPTTVVSNNIDEIRNLFRDGKATLAKRLSSHRVPAESNYSHLGLYEITSEFLNDNSSSTKVAPSIYQNIIPKRHEYRVNFVSGAFFASKISARDGNNLNTDWRRDAGRIKIEEIELSKSLIDLIAKFMLESKLHIGAFDFGVETENAPFFFECNPEGQWLWLERITGQAISAEVAKLLDRVANGGAP